MITEENKFLELEEIKLLLEKSICSTAGRKFCQFYLW